MNPKLKQYLIHSGLFIVTFFTTTLAGAEWTYGKSLLSPGYSWSDFSLGLPYSICFLAILTCHEFGHYFTAVYYRVKTTLPYYIPIPPLLLNFSLGTLGALIRIKSPVRSTQQNFDIGIAGPLAGFIVAFGFLLYAFTHLPPPEYIFQFHPEYRQYGLDYAAHVYSQEAMKPGLIDVVIGKNLLFLFFENFVADPTRLPNAHEIMHYPYLFAGFLSLVFTSINLLPIGQLDGGHVLYGLAGSRWHRIIASGVYIAFLFYACLGFIQPTDPIDRLIFEIPLAILFLFLALLGLEQGTKNTLMYALAFFTVQYLLALFFPTWKGYEGWLLFAFLIGRFVGITHPPSEIEEPLNRERKIAGWIALLIFVIYFTPDPLSISQMITPAQ